MKKYAVTAVWAALSGAILLAGDGGSMFQFNDQHFEVKYAYAFQMEIPDLGAMTPQDMQAGPGKMKWKKSLAIALSDKAFDTQALAKADQPYDALDRMVLAGALVVTVSAGKGGSVDMLRISLPRSEQALQIDTQNVTLTLDAPKGGKLSGRLVIKGDRKMHEFDPDHIPFIEADIGFATVVPAS